jgi:hypothetical protein
MAEDATPVSPPPPAQPVLPPIGFLFWTILLTLAAAVMFVIYGAVVFSADWSPCGTDEFGFGIGYGQGGPANSYTTAGVIDAVLWIAAGLAGFHFRRRRGRVFLAFAALYVVGLVVLWEITPAIWGKGVCA